MFTFYWSELKSLPISCVMAPNNIVGSHLDTKKAGNSELVPQLRVNIAFNGFIFVTYQDRQISFNEFQQELRGICNLGCEVFKLQF